MRSEAEIRACLALVSEPRVHDPSSDGMAIALLWVLNDPPAEKPDAAIQLRESYEKKLRRTEETCAEAIAAKDAQIADLVRRVREKS